MSSQKFALPNHNTAKQTSRDGVSHNLDPYAPAAEYYGKSHAHRKVAKSRTFSAHDRLNDTPWSHETPSRRWSGDAQGNMPRQYQLDVKDTLKILLAREDTDHNIQITIDDHGPKTISLATVNSGGYLHFDVRGTYMLSNLLQELTLANKHRRNTIVLDEARLNENPVKRMARLVKDEFWTNLTRRIDGSNIFKVAQDPKDWTSDPRPRIYIPHGAPEQYDYYKRIAAEHPDKRLDVQWLSEDPGNPEYVRDLNDAPGLLAIAMERVEDTHEGKPDFRGLPFVVPGGRFNELYGWDSYMETLGLLVNGHVYLCESMVKHFCFSIRHYGKILNANRTYYLCRSQPPFLTDMALRVHERIKDRPDSLEFLRNAILAAIKDYYSTWMSQPRHDPVSGLSRYVPGGLGVPPETEATHFVHILTPYAKKHNMSFDEFVKAYNHGDVREPKLDEYFLHDRSVRESGHDTSYRLENVSAHLATVDLNSCLYKYEFDIEFVIRTYFGDKLDIPAEWRFEGQTAVETSSRWLRRANKRRQTMNNLMWDDDKGMFFDYNTEEKKQTGYESATTFWAMWAGAATPKQACIMVEKALPRFEVHGGLVSGTEESRGHVGLTRPNRQWDYPFGWAPQQILAWIGLQKYEFEAEAQRLAYRWIFMCTKAFVDFNGVVVEKYNVTRQIDPHKVTAEYGNQGSEFKGVATEGFGWVNASYVFGLQFLTSHMRRALGAVTTWDTFKKMTEAANDIDAAEIQRKAKVHSGEDEKVHVAPHVRHAVLPHSHEDEHGHKAMHGDEERKGHKGPDGGQLGHQSVNVS